MHYFYSGSIFFMLSTHFLCAQSHEPYGARAVGMGYATVTVADEWSSFFNIAGLASQKKYAAGLCYKNDYALRAFRKTSCHLAGPLCKGGAVLSFYRSGNDVCRTNRVSAGYAHKIGLVSLGLQLHYVQVAMEDLGVRRNLVFDFGGIAELLPGKLFFGANVFNVNQAKLKEELLPVVMKAGLSYRPGKKLMLNGEVEKDLLYKATVKAGIEYALLDKFRIRTGINTHPFVNYFGTGFQNKILQVDYAVAIHTQLGYSHVLSLSLFFNR